MNYPFKIFLSAAFVALVAYYANGIVLQTNGIFLVLAAVFGAYMAMNIGANDVANNVGPAVGAGALTLGGAIVMAAIFETMGSLVAGGDVVGTIKDGIISIDAFGGDSMVFVYAMSAALLASAIWLNIATWLGAPVSTTHAIVGGVLGGGIAAGGFSVVDWATLGGIVASWVISPLLGGVMAAVFLYIIKSQIIYQEDTIAAAKKMVPLVVALMVAAFMTYLVLKGLGKVWPSIVEVFGFLPQSKKPSIGVALLIGGMTSILTYVVLKPSIAKKVVGMQGTRTEINLLFTVPLIFSAALLSFAHGANDVANAVGPLAAVYDALSSSSVSTEASIPLWIMIVGGLGISIGLALFGPRLIQTVGSEITELDQMRAFSIMMASAITVIVASQLGLPVSSTHIAVGAIFGVGFLREWLDSRTVYEQQDELKLEIEKLQTLKEAYANAEVGSGEDYKNRLELYMAHRAQKKKIKILKRSMSKNYVKREMIKKIIAAWLITVPLSAVLSAIVFYVISAIML